MQILSVKQRPQRCAEHGTLSLRRSGYALAWNGTDTALPAATPPCWTLCCSRCLELWLPQEPAYSHACALLRLLLGFRYD